MALLVIDHSESLVAIEKLKNAIADAEKYKCRITSQLLGFLNDMGVAVLPSENINQLARKKLYSLWAENNRQELDKHKIERLNHWNSTIRHTIATQLQRRSQHEFKPKKHKVLHSAAVEEGNYFTD